MNIGLLVWFFFSILGLGIVFGKHGTPRADYNGWLSLLAFILDGVIAFWIAGWHF